MMRMRAICLWVIVAALSASGATSFSVTPYVQHPSTNAMSVIWFTKGGSGEAATISWRSAAVGTTQSRSVTGAWATALTNNVADGWATFVADANLAYGGTYRVMLDQTSATTFHFTRPGKIAFDTVLCPFNGTVTAVAGLPLTRTTSGTITTYTAGRLYLLLR